MIAADDKLPGEIIFKNVAKLFTWVIKDDDEFYLPIFLEKTFSITKLVGSDKVGRIG